MNKNLFVLFVLTISFFFNFNISKATDNIAFIDLNYVFDNSKAGKKIINEIKDKQKKNNNDFKNLKEKFDKDKELLISQKNVLSKNEFDKKLVELEKNLKNYNLKIREKNNSLTKFQLDARKEFYITLQPILEAFAKENAIDIILKNENVLIGKTSLDITKNILDLFDAKVKKITIK